MRTTVALSMSVASGMPLAAIGAREEVAPHCVTDLGDSTPAGAATLPLVQTCAYLFSRTAWSLRTQTENSWALATV